VRVFPEPKTGVAEKKNLKGWGKGGTSIRSSNELRGSVVSLGKVPARGPKQGPI